MVAISCVVAERIPEQGPQHTSDNGSGDVPTVTLAGRGVKVDFGKKAEESRRKPEEDSFWLTAKFGEVLRGALGADGTERAMLTKGGL